MKLIVIDPRRTETARRAAIHIQPRPGEDPTILAGIDQRHHRAKASTTPTSSPSTSAGFDDPGEQVAPFTPEYVAERADVPAEQLIDGGAAVRHARRKGAAWSTSAPGRASRCTATSANTSRCA